LQTLRNNVDSELSKKMKHLLCDPVVRDDHLRRNMYPLLLFVLALRSGHEAGLVPFAGGDMPLPHGHGPAHTRVWY
jgi:hypothetical protein